MQKFCFLFALLSLRRENEKNIECKQLHSSLAFTSGKSERKCTRNIIKSVCPFIHRPLSKHDNSPRRKRVINIWENYNSDKFSTRSLHVNETSFSAFISLRYLPFKISPSHSETVLASDVDIHNVLPQQKAIRFAQFLHKSLWPSLCASRSTNEI